jgi:hypothetical protein
MVVTQSALPSGGQQLASISASKPCVGNPCDPSCQNYLEAPPNGGLTAQYNTNAAWQSGSVSSFPADIQSLVSSAACQTAADCQQNQQCVNVATDATCTAHDKCQVGEALGGTCSDACVTNICNQNPSCCQSNGQPSCNPGDTLNSDGSRCYHQNIQYLNWDGARAACQALGTGWDLICIQTQPDEDLIVSLNYVNSWLGIRRVSDTTQSPFACINGEQTLSDGQLAQGVWPWHHGEPNNWGTGESCTEMYAEWDDWNDLSCNAPLPSWCEGPLGIPVAWSGSCVDSVATLCGATCNVSGTNQPAACQAWAPGQTNPNDASFDLSLGVPCQGQIPVCNHGTAPAPAGAVVYVLPVSLPFGGPEPDVASALGSCTTSTQVDPGACVMVGGCSDYLNGNAELWVTEPSGGEARNNDDNWGYNIPNVACGAPQCLSAAAPGPCFGSNTLTYDYSGVCPNNDQVPQWSFLTYDSSTPGNSSINFSVMAASSVDQLATEPVISLVTVSQAAGNETCDLSGPPSKNCPVNLYQALLPQGNTNGAVLRLNITINPSSDGAQSPILNNWRISYSCPAGT